MARSRHAGAPTIRGLSGTEIDVSTGRLGRRRLIRDAGLVAAVAGAGVALLRDAPADAAATAVTALNVTDEPYNAVGDGIGNTGNGFEVIRESDTPANLPSDILVAGSVSPSPQATGNAYKTGAGGNHRPTIVDLEHGLMTLPLDEPVDVPRPEGAAYFDAAGRRLRVWDGTTWLSAELD